MNSEVRSGSSGKCPKCHGAGWVCGTELDDADEATRADTMTHYTCDEPGCAGRPTKSVGVQSVTTSYPKFPREPNGEGGWIISTAYLEAIRKHTEARPDPWPTGWEEIQEVLLAIEALANNGVPA